LLPELHTFPFAWSGYPGSTANLPIFRSLWFGYRDSNSFEGTVGSLESVASPFSVATPQSGDMPISPFASVQGNAEAHGLASPRGSSSSNHMQPRNSLGHTRHTLGQSTLTSGLAEAPAVEASASVAVSGSGSHGSGSGQCSLPHRTKQRRQDHQNLDPDEQHRLSSEDVSCIDRRQDSSGDQSVTASKGHMDDVGKPRSIGSEQPCTSKYSDANQWRSDDRPQTHDSIARKGIRYTATETGNSQQGACPPASVSQYHRDTDDFRQSFIRGSRTTRKASRTAANQQLLCTIM
jgi:hypothetical protein